MKTYIQTLLVFFLFISCSKDVEPEIIPKYNLKVSVTPSEGGTVTPSEGSYQTGTSVSLLATPSPEYIFKEWNGGITGTTNPVSVTMSSNMNISVVFEKRNYPLSITIEGEGTVTEELLSSKSNTDYPSGSVVKLTAVPVDGWEFENWSGDYVGTDNPINITVDKEKTLTVKFIQIVDETSFDGYKVEAYNNMEEPQYWRDCGVMYDVIANKFNIDITGNIGNAFFFPQIITGDFNKDGWIDVFNPGTGSYSGNLADYTQWFIWNPTSKTFENKNLFNDKTITSFGGNQRRSVSVDLNMDGYTDVVIFDHGDDMPIGGQVLQPLRIVLSDGKGEYELKEINPTGIIDYFHSGDIADIDGDGNYDLVCACGNRVYVCWGISGYPYFNNDQMLVFDVNDYNSPLWMQEIGGGGTYNVTIGDVDGDGKNDIIFGTFENNTQTKILINKGNKIFDNTSVINLPKFNSDANGYMANDFRIIDINNDGLNDILANYSINYNHWGMLFYIQKSQGVFEIDLSRVQYTTTIDNHYNWKPWLIYYDFNKDGIKDFSYIDSGNTPDLQQKTIFIRNGNTFIEEDFYQYDNFCKSIKP